MSVAEALARSYATLHPAEVARLGDADATRLPDLLGVLSPKLAAAILRASSVHSASRALPKVPRGHLASIVGVLGLPSTAVLVSHLPERDRNVVFEALPPGDAAQLRGLSSHPPDTAAGVIETEVVAVLQSRSVAEALAEVRGNSDNARYYVYVLGEGHRLVGVVTLRQLFGAPLGQPVSELMTRNPECLHAADRPSLILGHAGWQRYPTLPVIDDEGRFLGAIGYARFRALESEMGIREGRPSAADTANHLAEVYSIGASALLRWGTLAIADGSDAK